MEGTVDCLYKVIQKNEKPHCIRCIADDCGLFLFAYKFTAPCEEFIVVSGYEI